MSSKRNAKRIPKSQDNILGLQEKDESNAQYIRRCHTIKERITTRMADYAIVFDISTKEMKEDGHTPSEITKTYNQLSRLAKECGFTERIQGSAYRTNNGDGVNSLLKLIARKDEIPLFCNYKDRVHFFRCDEYSDITHSFNDLRQEGLA